MADWLKGAQGAGAGASLGGKVGSVVPGIGTAIGAGVGGVVGLVAGLFGGGDDPSPEEQAYMDMVAELEQLGLPPHEALTVAYDRIAEQGKLTPKLEAVHRQADTELKKIQTDPAYGDAQREALARLKMEGESGGMMLEDRAAVEEALSAAGQQAKGREDAILMNMAERGMGGSGQELAARLSSAQNAANESRKSGLQVAADARRRALEAVLKGGQLATDLRSQQFGEQEKIYGAQDVINRFNTSNLQDVAKRGVERQMDADKYNIDTEFARQKFNVGTDMAEQKHNTGVVADQYGRQFDKIVAKGKYGAAAGQAGQAADATRGAAIGEAIKGAGDLIDKFGTSKATSQPLAQSGAQFKAEDVANADEDEELKKKARYGSIA